MGKKSKMDRSRSRSKSPARQKKKGHRDHSSSPHPSPPHPSPPSHHKRDGHSKKKQKRKSLSPSQEDRQSRRRSVSPSSPDHHRQQQQQQNLRGNRNHPRSSSISPESKRKLEKKQRKEERHRAGGGGTEAPGGRWNNDVDSSRGEGGAGGRESGGGGGARDGPPKKEDDSKEMEKEKANLGLSGKLAEDTNTFRGVVIKYNEPAEARKPKTKWRLYQFKGEEALPTLFVHRQSAYLIGRDRLIADIPVDHPSCSKQHAVLQYRMSEYTRTDGSRGKRVLPYVIDLGATNKTYLNNKPIDAQRYHELREKDVLKFGFSTREYVLLNDKSADSDEVDEGEA